MKKIVVLTVGFFLLWEMVVKLLHLPPYLLPTPITVFHVLWAQSALLCQQALPTITESLVGLLGAILCGSLFALAMAYIQLLRDWLKPVLIISQALPTFAIAPLIVLWLGYGISSKIVITLLMLFFPVTSAFFDGLQQTPQIWLDYARIVNASAWRTLRHIRLPAALPNLATGIRVATAGAPLGAVIGEWTGSSQGLGFLMLNANARLQIDVMFAALLVLVVWSLLLYAIVDKILKRWLVW